MSGSSEIARGAQVSQAESDDGLHAKQVLERINNLRLNNNLIDLILIVGDEQFPAHKVVFSSLCPVYKARRTPEVERCSLAGVTSDIFKLILDFAYTGNINLTENNVEHIWHAAARLQAVPLTQACETYIGKIINFENCFKFHLFGIDKKSAEIRNVAFDFIERNFSAVAEQNEFLNLPLEMLIDIIKSDRLIVKGEEVVYTAAMRWIQVNEDRKQYLPVILHHVRLIDLSAEFFQVRIYQDADVMTSPECMRLVTDVLMHKLKPKPQAELLCFRPRSSTAYLEGVFIMGTQNDGSSILNRMVMMSLEKGKLFNLKYPPFCPKTIVASVCTKRAVYLMNCIYEVPDRKYISKLWCVESNAGDWRELEGPVAEKRYTGLVELNGHLYAIGGGPGNVVERYDPDTNSWTYVAPLPVKVYFPAIVTLNGKIYVLGGTKGHPQARTKTAKAGTKSEKEVSDTVQRYDPDSNSWTALSPLCFLTKRLLACAFNNKIFVMDGCIKNNAPSRAVHILDISTNNWVLGPAFNKAYSNPGILTVLKEQLTVIDTTRLPELDMESMTESCRWEVSTKRINVNIFKTVTRMFGGGIKVNSF